MTSDRGHLKVFLGMAAGVGKTVRMLDEGRAELEAGRDVVIGLLETHGRAETEARAVGLERLPRRRVTYRGTTFTDLDVVAVLARAPELCLIDELAHTNAPGLDHVKRFEDVEQLLAAGIDVLSVAELSGVRVRETVPDSVLRRADEVVLVDVTPEALLDRLRAGKIYPRERIDAALSNFFRIENLGALRETVLRQVAENVEARRAEPADPAVAQAVGERLMALIEPYPGAQRLVRRAWRSAQRLSAPLDLLWVAPPGGARPAPDGEAARSLHALRQLASVLGATLLVEEGDDVAATAARVAGERGITYILLGAPRPARGLGRLREPLPMRLVRLVPGVDVRIVADRTRMRGRGRAR
jgi:two-component system sensor histidine kinase KdpD